MAEMLFELVGERMVPVLPSAVVIPRIVVLIALALPVTDDAVVDGGVSVGIGGGVGKIPPNCATLAAGDISTAAASAIAREQRLRDTVLFMQTSLPD